jgi:hypothetical protein
MYLVGYDGNQNIHITADNLFSNAISGTENTIAMFGADGAVLVDSMLLQNAEATLLTVGGQLNVDAAATFDTSITVTGDSTLNGNVILGDASTDLITQTGTLYLNGPVKDTTDTLGDNDEILVSDENGELNFQKLSETHVHSSELVVQSIKANEALTKGDPVYIVDFQVGQEVNIVAKADASNPAKMPATGIIDEDYANQAFGTMTAFGSFNTDFDASGGSENWSIGDTLFVKAGGGLTNIKPTGSDLIQNIAIVSRNHQQTGELEVVALGRTNDIPNLTPGKIWVGSTGNTIESSSITFTEATGAVQLNEYGIGTHTGTVAKNLAVDADGNVIETSGDIIDGSGTLNYVAKFTPDGNSLGDSRIYDNGTNVGIGDSNPPERFTLRTAADGLGSEGIFIKNTFAGTSPIVDSKSPFLSLATSSSSTYNSTIYMGKQATATNQESKIEWSNANNGLSIYVAGQGSYREHVRFGDLANSTARTFFNGNVGIGTTSPQQKLDVNGDIAIKTATQLSFNTSNGTLSVGGDAGQLDLLSSSIFINYSGNVGIGTIIPSEKLDVSGNIKMTETAATTDTDKFVVLDSGVLKYRTGAQVISDLPTDSRYVAVAGDTMTGSLTMNNSQIQITDSGTQARMSINNTGTGDPQINFQLSGSSKFTIGVDDSDSDKFKISGSSALGSNDRIVVDSSGNVGIGTTSPAHKLHVVGNTKIEGVVIVNSANSSLYIGDSNTGQSSTSTGDRNVVIGPSAFRSNTSAKYNTAVGHAAMQDTTTGNYNSVLGNQALRDNIDGDFNVAVGNQTMAFTTNSSNNTAVGYRALYQAQSDSNTAIGQGAFNSLQSSTSSGGNTGIGQEVLNKITSGRRNVGVGYAAGQKYGGGNNNVVTANDSVFIGADSDAGGDNQTNQIVIGYNAIGLGSNTAVLGNNSIVTTQLKGNVGIGTTDPKAKLDVDGNFRINTNNLTLSNTPAWGVPTQNIIGAEDNTNGATLTLMNTSATIPANGVSGTLQFVALDDGRNNGGSGYTTASISAVSKLAPGSGQSGQGALVFKTGGYYSNITEKMRIDGLSGNVGIGTTNPVYQLQLSLNSAAKPTSSAWTVVSDERVKTNIRPYETGLQELLQIEPKLFDYNGKAGFDAKTKNNIGVIAQEIKDIMPETVKKYNAKLNEEDKEDTELYNFDSHALTFALINSVKELNAKIKNLETKIQTLENQ